MDTTENTQPTASLNEEPALAPRPRGFACLSSEQRRHIASQGGKIAHARGVAHKFAGEKAREAGQKGGEAISRDVSYMAEIGRRGGLKRGESMRRFRTVPQH